MARNLVSPFVHTNIKDALAAYCAMPHASRAGFKKPTMKEFTKLYNERHEAAVAAQASKSGPVEVATSTPVTAEVLGALGVDPDVIASLQAAGVLESSDTNEDEATEYATRTPKDQISKDAARNAVLWALNTEGFLILNPNGGNTPITQEEGTGLMAATFGPLVQ